MKRRNVLFWPGVILGSLLVFIVGTIVLSSKEIADIPPLAKVFHRNTRKVLADSMPYDLEEGVTKPIYDMSDAIISKNCT